MIRERRARASEYRLEDSVQRRAVMSSRHLIILIFYVRRGSPLCRARDYDARIASIILVSTGVEVEENERTLLESRVSLIKKKKKKKGNKRTPRGEQTK